MNIRSQNPHERGGLVPAFVALFLGALVLFVGIFPGAALADSATDQYTESPIPSVPGNTNNEPGKGASRDGSANGEAGSTSTPITSGTAGTAASEGSVNASGSGKNTKTSDSGTAAGGSTQGSNGDLRKREEAAATKAFADFGDEGGSATLLILCILIGIPVLAGFGIAIHRALRSRRTDSDDDNRLSSALGG